MMHPHPKNDPVHFPPDRALRVRFRPLVLPGLFLLLVLPVVIAWVQYGLSGLPAVRPLAAHPFQATHAHPFPGWVRLTHYVNFLFLVLMARSGLSILMDHPRLYFTDHCTPGSDWATFTPLDVPTDRVWTAKDDARYISHWLALPGYRHTVGLARHWHRLGAVVWLLNGLVFVTLVLFTGERHRLVPASLDVFPRAWAIFVYYVTLHWPPEPDPLVRYNALQQLAYFSVVFIMAPLSCFTGLAMSPAIDNRFRWYPRLFGGRQSARSIHFLLLIGYMAFLVTHVAMVCMNGLSRNMNDIVFGRDAGGYSGILAGLAAIVSVLLACLAAHWLSWNQPRALQLASRLVHAVLRKLTFRRWQPRVQYLKSDISPFFWPNGKMPVCHEWKALAAGNFKDYRLKVTGLVERPIEISLEELKSLGRQEQITMHHCIQGWSGVAQWAGLPLARLV